MATLKREGLGLMCNKHYTPRLDKACNDGFALDSSRFYSSVTFVWVPFALRASKPTLSSSLFILPAACYGDELLGVMSTAWDGPRRMRPTLNWIDICREPDGSPSENVWRALSGTVIECVRVTSVPAI